MDKKLRLHHLSIYDWLCVGLLLISFLIRLANFDYPIINGEVQRDYLVGRHIAYFGERVLTGPCCLWNGTFGNLRHSPVYYYFIAFLTRIYDNLLFVSFVNLMLQVFSIWMLYEIGKKLFTPRTGLVAATLFSFNFEVTRQSLYMWQPYLMGSLSIMVLFFLVLAWKKHRFRYLLISMSLFVIAGAIHSPLFAFTPAFLVMVIYILRRLSSRRWQYSILGLSAVGVWFVAYGSVLIYIFGAPLAQKYVSGALTNLWVKSFAEWMYEFAVIKKELFSILFIQSSFLSYTAAIMCVIVICLRLGYKNVVRRRFLLLVVTDLQFIFLITLIHAPIWGFYLTPLLPLIFLILAESFVIIPRHTHLSQTVTAVLVFFLLLVMSNALYFFKYTSAYTIDSEINQVTERIANRVARMTVEEGKGQLNFFKIYVVVEGVRSPPLADLVFWAPLEKKLNTPFIKLINEVQNYALINSDKYVFLICQSDPLPVTDEKCKGTFLQKHSVYSVIEQIYKKEPFTVYITRKRI